LKTLVVCVSFQDLIVTYQSAPKGGLSVFYTVPTEELADPSLLPVKKPSSGQDTINRIKGLIDNEKSKFFDSGSSNNQGKHEP
jgi:hypothetical protein